jgi:hypothetical protein
VNCPQSQELGDYHLELVTVDRRQQIRLHLEVCPHCQQELADLARYLKTLEPELQPGLMERARIWIAERLPDLSASTFAPLPGVRGDNGPERVFSYRAGEAQVSLEIQESGAAGLTMLGLLLGVDPQGFQAQLWRAGEPLESTGVDEFGNFGLNIPEAGSYDLILAGPDGEIHIQNLEM